MMKYNGNLRDDYRLARVKEVYPDSKGLVRTVKVNYRRRDKREPAESYWKKKLEEEIVAVQRLAIIHSDGEPIPDEELKVKYGTGSEENVNTKA